MQRNKDASLGDRACCFFMRFFTLMLLAFVGLALSLAAQGRPGALGQVGLLFVLGSVIPYMGQSVADASGAFSRVGLINEIVRLYSYVWLPSVATFILWRFSIGEFGEAGSALLAGAFFWLIGYSTRVRRIQREQAAA